jgi:hypothetical protein
MPGPVPKRSEERVRRHKPDVPTDVIEMVGRVEVPDLGIPFAHDLVIDFWAALRESGQTKYYEPTDWQYARMALWFVNDMLRRAEDSGKAPSSMMLQQVNSMLADLLVAEGQRRRVRMEIEREQQTAEVFKISDHLKKRFDSAH